MHQLSSLWWRAHAHAANSLVFPGAAMIVAARTTSANVPADRITSARFIAFLPLSPLWMDCCWHLDGEVVRSAPLGLQDEVLEDGLLRAYQPRAATAIPSKICPIDSWNDPGVGSRNMVTGIETIKSSATQHGYTSALIVATPNRISPIPK